MPRSAVPWGDIALFTAVAYAVAWLIHLPLLLRGAGPDDPAYGLAAQTYMLTPALVVVSLFAVRVWRPQEGFLRATGIWPLRPFGRLAGALAFALVVFAALGLAATLIAGATGALALDLKDFSLLRQTLAEQFPGTMEGAPESGFPVAAYLSGLGLLIATVLPMSLLLCFGEELAWRGYLLPRLLPAGLWTALLVSGAVHGLWHGPQLFIQYTSGSFTLGQVLLFLASVVAFAAAFGFLRLVTGSVWPAVVGHAANNTFNIVPFLTLAHVDGVTDRMLYPGGLGGVIGVGVLAAGAAAMAFSLQRRQHRAGA
ncbi:CPBP family intramembrane metalloprotease [Nocardiopsis coralliicola]